MDTVVVEIPLDDLRPRIVVPTSGYGGYDVGTAKQEAAWRELRTVIYERLRPHLEGGWEVVPGTLGPSCLELAVEDRGYGGCLGMLLFWVVAIVTLGWGVSLFGDRYRDYAKKATVLLQRRP